jgi:hypothetical protein
MKKIVILLFIVIVLVSGCKNEIEETNSLSVSSSEIENASSNSFDEDFLKNMEIGFKTGTFFDKNWDEPLGTYKGDCVPTKEVAMEIATSIMNELQKNGKFKKCVLASVFYDEVDEIWIVIFCDYTEGRGFVTLGGGCTIAIKKSNAQILRIWTGE